MTLCGYRTQVLLMTLHRRADSHTNKQNWSSFHLCLSLPCASIHALYQFYLLDEKEAAGVSPVWRMKVKERGSTTGRNWNLCLWDMLPVVERRETLWQFQTCGYCPEQCISLGTVAFPVGFRNPELPALLCTPVEAGWPLGHSTQLTGSGHLVSRQSLAVMPSAFPFLFPALLLWNKSHRWLMLQLLKPPLQSQSRKVEGHAGPGTGHLLWPCVTAPLEGEYAMEEWLLSASSVRLLTLQDNCKGETELQGPCQRLASLIFPAL